MHRRLGRRSRELCVNSSSWDWINNNIWMDHLICNIGIWLDHLINNRLNNNHLISNMCYVCLERWVMNILSMINFSIIYGLLNCSNDWRQVLRSAQNYPCSANCFQCEPVGTTHPTRIWEDSVLAVLAWFVALSMALPAIVLPLPLYFTAKVGKKN